MKILYIITGRYPTERAYGIQIERTIQAMRIFGAEVEVKLPMPFMQKLLYLGKFGYWLRTLIFIKLLFLSSNLNDYDALYTRDPLAAYALSFMNNKVFLELHDISSPRLVKQAAKRVRGIVVISKGLCNRLVQLEIEENKILIAPDGVDYPKFAINLDKESARKEFNLPLDKKIVLYAGLFDEWKGYRTLLEASKLFSPDTLLVMAGGRPEQVNELKEQFANVQFLGWTPYEKLPILQRAVDVLVLPNSAKPDISRLYTSPLKLFAYMCSGVPIVVSDLPSLREIVDENMVTFAVPDDPKSLAHTIANVLENTSLAKSKALRACEVVKKFTWQSRAHAILTFIKSCESQ